MELELGDKRALVTGGSRGIGRAIVLALAHQGVKVAACFRQQSSDVSALGEELSQIGNGSHVVQADVAEEASVAALLDGVVERFGGVDVLVNNAGVVSHSTLDMDLEEWRRVLDTNLTGVFLVTRATEPHMPDGSSIINLTSAAAMVGMAARTHYTASKAGVIGFTRSLCKELGPRQIRANAIAPGIIETDQVSGLTPAQRDRYAGLAALGRLGLPEDVADVALFLASDLSRFVSGVTLHVDGGI
ncbi:MAG TPA: SDR family NAD(P)-dependent oxidoreductase [Solirubrobacteraceae bacterium]|jgi:3-oxoacyl-[acyl-carrier protein] reductase|nr:SDR family NAD(P)-dependent oxidoreductase [Solirubrobacteraceae bacterium]